jgi:hypothetical protein
VALNTITLTPVHASQNQIIKDRKIYLFFKLPVSRFLAINIEGKIGQLTVRRTSSFTNDIGDGSFVGKMNAITNRLHNSFKIKDTSLTGRNYEQNKKYIP